MNAIMSRDRVAQLPWGLVLAFALSWMLTLPAPSSAILPASSDGVSAEGLGAMALSALLFLAWPQPLSAFLLRRKPFVALCAGALVAFLIGHLAGAAAPVIGEQTAAALSFAVFLLTAFCQVAMLLGCLLRIVRLDFVSCALTLILWQFGIAVLRTLSLFIDSGLVTPFAFALVPILLNRYDRSPRGALPTYDPRAAAKTPNGRTGHQKAEKGQRPVPYRLFAIYALVVFAIYLLHGLAGEPFVSFSFIGEFIAVALMLVAVAASKRFLPIQMLYRSSLVFLELSVVGFALLNPIGSWLAVTALDVSYVLFATFFFTILCNVLQRVEANPIRMFALACAIEYSAAIAGALASRLVTHETLTVSLVLLAAVIALAFVLFSTDDDYRSGWGTAKPTRGYMDPLRYLENLADACASISMQYSLSRRESDVLLLLAQQKTVPQIADELFVSQATVKSHTNSIYKKLQVHSRKELLAFIDIKPGSERTSETAQRSP